MTIISLGMQCTNAVFKRDNDKKSASFPFDWMLSTPKFVFNMLTLLLEENMNVSELVKNHFFVCDKMAYANGYEYYNICDDGDAICNTLHEVIFPHDEYSVENIDKYARRFSRLKAAILNTTDKLYYVHINIITGEWELHHRRQNNNQ